MPLAHAARLHVCALRGEPRVPDRLAQGIPHGAVCFHPGRGPHLESAPGGDARAPPLAGSRISQPGLLHLHLAPLFSRTGVLPSCVPRPPSSLKKQRESGPHCPHAPRCGSQVTRSVVPATWPGLVGGAHLVGTGRGSILAQQPKLSQFWVRGLLPCGGLGVFLALGWREAHLGPATACRCPFLPLLRSPAEGAPGSRADLSPCRVLLTSADAVGSWCLFCGFPAFVGR